MSSKQPQPRFDLPLDPPADAIAPAIRRCLGACASSDHRHAEALRQTSRSMRTRNHARRRDRMSASASREEAASRDFRKELRA